MAIPDYTDGISMLPTLMGKGTQNKHENLYWELGRSQAVRVGKWKGIRRNSNDELGTIELYDLESDIQERNNLADNFPEVVKQIEEIMRQEHEPAKISHFKQKVLGD